MAARWRPIAIVGTALLLLVGALALLWSRASQPLPSTSGVVSRASLAAADPIARWWHGRPVLTVEGESVETPALLDAIAIPDLAPELSGVWSRVQAHEAAEAAAVPRPLAMLPANSGLRGQLRELASDYRRMSAERDLIAAANYRASIDDWWAPYPASVIYPPLSTITRTALLEVTSQVDITPAHLQLSDLVARQQRRFGWAAEAEVEAIRTAFHERLDLDLAVYDDAWNAQLDTRLAALDREMSAVYATDLPQPPLILHAVAPLDPPLLHVRLQSLLDAHGAQFSTSMPDSVMAPSTTERQALADFWDTYESLRERRIQAALAGQHLTEGAGGDITSLLQSLLFPAVDETGGPPS